MTKAIEGVDVVFHLAAKVAVRVSVIEFYDDTGNNIMDVLSLLEVFNKNSVKKLILASSTATYADSPIPNPIDEKHLNGPISPYGISKLAGGKYYLNITVNKSIGFISLRYFNTYGPGQPFTPNVVIFIEMLFQGRTQVILGYGEEKRDFCFCWKYRSNLLALNSYITFKIFNVGTGHPTSVNDKALLLCKLISPSITPASTEKKAGELRYSISNISKTLKPLGYNPAESL